MLDRLSDVDIDRQRPMVMNQIKSDLAFLCDQVLQGTSFERADSFYADDKRRIEDDKFLERNEACFYRMKFASHDTDLYVTIGSQCNLEDELLGAEALNSFNHFPLLKNKDEKLPQQIFMGEVGRLLVMQIEKEKFFVLVEVRPRRKRNASIAKMQLQVVSDRLLATMRGSDTPEEEPVKQIQAEVMEVIGRS